MKLFLYTFDPMYLPGKCNISNLLIRNFSKNNVVKDDECINDIIYKMKTWEFMFNDNKIQECKKYVRRWDIQNRYWIS